MRQPFFLLVALLPICAAVNGLGIKKERYQRKKLTKKSDLPGRRTEWYALPNERVVGQRRQEKPNKFDHTLKHLLLEGKNALKNRRSHVKHNTSRNPDNRASSQNVDTRTVHGLPHDNKNNANASEKNNARIKHGKVKFLEVSDFDEVFNEEDAKGKKKDNNGILYDVKESDSDLDSEEPITEDSDEHESEVNAESRHLKKTNSKSHDKDESPGTKEDDDVDGANDDDERGQTHEHKQHHAPQTPMSSDDAEDDDLTEEDEDNEKQNHEANEDEDEDLHISKKPKQKTDHESFTWHLSDQILPGLFHKPRLTSGQKINSKLLAMLEQLQALKQQTAINRAAEYAKFEQLQREMYQQQQLRYANTAAQNVGIPAVYYMQRPTPGIPVNVPLIVSPTVGIARPLYMYAPTSRSRAQPGDPGFNINVDGLNGVFTKTPGMVLQFQSPDSEVTIVKKKNEVLPVHMAKGIKSSNT